MLSGTALATLVVAGMFSTVSINQAAAGCFGLSNSDDPDVRICTDSSSDGITIGPNNGEDIEVYVLWDGGNNNFSRYEMADGFEIIQNGAGSAVNVAIFGGGLEDTIPNVFDNPVLETSPYNIFPLDPTDLVPVTFSNDGVVDQPSDTEGSDLHAFEVRTNGGPVNFLAVGDVTFETTGAGQDGVHIRTNGGPAFWLGNASFDVVQDGIDVLTRGGDALVGYWGEMVAGGDGIKINTANANNNPNGGDIFAYVGEAANEDPEIDVVEIDVVGNGLDLRSGNNTGLVGAWIDGDIDAGQSAIRAVGGEVFVWIGETSTVSGLGDGTSVPVVYLNGRDSNALLNLGEISSNSSDDLGKQSRAMAIEVGRGAASIYNFGTITGRVDASNNNDEFFNAGLWQFSGETRFGANVLDENELPGEDVLRNVFVTTEGEDEVFGVIENAVDGGASETAQYLGLEKFYNGGVISLRDQEFGDIFYRDRAYTSGDFIGEGGLLAIDADLSDFNADADRFIIGGDVSGTTFVDVNVIGFGSLQFDARGIPVVEIAGNVDPDTNFFLNGGPIDAGLFSYDLYYTEDMDGYLQNNNGLGQASLATGGLTGVAPVINSMWVLAATLDAEAYQLPVLAYGASNLWHASAGIWGDRTTDLRSAFGGFGGGGADIVVDPASPATAAIGPGFWGRAFGGTLERDFDNTFDVIGGGTATFEDSFRQNYYGVVGGLDAVHDVGVNSAVLYGLLGGFTGSDLDFDLSDGDATYQQVSLGAYATWINGGFFADVLAKADFGNMDYSADGDSGSSSYTSVGVTADVGYRFGFAAGWFVEPKATLAYVNTSFDDLDILGAGVAFDDGDSLRGRLGARVGTTIDHGGNLITPYVEASVWNEFSGDYSAAFYDIGGTPSVGYDAGGTYGEVVAGADFANVGAGWTAFGKGAVQFGEDEMLGFSGNLGLRKSW